MEKVLLGVVIGVLPSHAITVVQATLDFIYLSQLQMKTSKTLDALEHCLKTFHENKKIIVDLKIREHFNIPKLHAIMHYVNCIRALGSPDGYNTESPERLHIDFAKEAYRASNKRDYMEQMALWLQRHEAMWLRESYLTWIEDRLSVVVEENEESEEVAEENEEGRVVAADNDVEGVIDDRLNVSTNVSTNKHSQAIFKRRLNYSLAKRPPYKNTTVDEIILNFGATDFISALSTFLRQNFLGTTIIPSIHDRFDVYKQLVIKLPHNPYLSDHRRTDRVRTLPFVKANGRTPQRPAHFDTAIIIEDCQLYKSDGGISGEFFFFYQYISYFNLLPGLRVAQVRLIFDLPSHFGTFQHPLAYIEWFTPFGRPDTSTGLHSITRSTRHTRRNSAIVSVDSILRSCHLMARYPRDLPSPWTTDNILEQGSIQYLLNSYINVDTFTLFKSNYFQ